MPGHSGTQLDGGNLVTSGGRVLAVTALGQDLEEARRRAYQGVCKIHFAGMHYRKDIGRKDVDSPATLLERPAARA